MAAHSTSSTRIVRVLQHVGEATGSPRGSVMLHKVHVLFDQDAKLWARLSDVWGVLCQHAAETDLGGLDAVVNHLRKRTQDSGCAASDMLCTVSDIQYCSHAGFQELADVVAHSAVAGQVEFQLWTEDQEPERSHSAGDKVQPSGDSEVVAHFNPPVRSPRSYRRAVLAPLVHELGTLHEQEQLGLFNAREAEFLRNELLLGNDPLKNLLSQGSRANLRPIAAAVRALVTSQQADRRG